MDVADELDITPTLLNAISLSFDQTWQHTSKKQGFLLVHIRGNVSFYFEHEIECLERYGKANTPPGMMYVNEKFPDIYFIVYNDRFQTIEDEEFVIQNIGRGHFVAENKHGDHSYGRESYNTGRHHPSEIVIETITPIGIELKDGIYISKTRKLIYYWPGKGDDIDIDIRSADTVHRHHTYNRIDINYAFTKTIYGSYILPGLRLESGVYLEATKLVEKEPRALTRPAFIIKTKEEVLERFDEIIKHFR